MDCNLCGKIIKNYNPDFNHLNIDDYHAIDICQECIDKFLRWQGKLFTKMFPTKAAKKRLESKS